MRFETLTREAAHEALSELGYRVAAEDIVVEARQARWVVRLPGERIAWFAASEEGRRRLATERRVLRTLEERCSFLAPRVERESPDGDIDVRRMVPGDDDPWRVYADVRDDAALAARLGTAIGTILAEQHTRVTADDVADWLPRRPEWPEPRDWIADRLPRVVDDDDLLARALAVLDVYDAVEVQDRVLVHGDVGFHNLGIDRTSRIVHGIYDYDGAAWADRHHDFRYLLFDFERDELLDAARAAYEPTVGVPIDEDRARLYNAACAISFLAYRDGTPPEASSCGRTLAQDLRWSRWAIARALGDGSRTGERS